jgi:hypothetical protein
MREQGGAGMEKIFSKFAPEHRAREKEKGAEGGGGRRFEREKPCEKEAMG